MNLPEQPPALLPKQESLSNPDLQKVPRRKQDPLNITLFVVNLFALLVMMAAAMFLVFTTLIQMTNLVPGMPTLDSPLQSFLLAGALAFSGFMLIPVLFHSFNAMVSRPDKSTPFPPIRLLEFAIFLGLLIIVAITAQFMGEISSTWFLLPPLVIAGMSLPVYILFRLGTAGIGTGSHQRAWNVFGLGLAAGPAIAGLVEVGAYLSLLFGGGMLLSINPDWQATFTHVASQVENAASMDKILTVLSPYLMNPVTISLVLLVVSVFIPLVEELSKPIGVWIFRRRQLTPQEGFALGVISGAGFALLESLLAASSNDGQWGVAFVARIGGGVMHILNTGLMGWAIASFWHEHRFWKLARTFGFVVLLHGLWNGLTVATIIGSLRVMEAPGGKDLIGSLLVMISAPGLILLAISGLIFLIAFNRRMHSHVAKPGLGETSG